MKHKEDCLGRDSPPLYILSEKLCFLFLVTQNVKGTFLELY